MRRRMQRFYFHLYNDIVAMDEEGIELPDLETAKAAAIINIRDLLIDDVKAGRVPLQHRIEIADDAGTILATVPFGDAVAVEG